MEGAAIPLTLPPLNALRAFEAAARTGSYVAAAEELGVSAAAVSQQIRKLEAHLGRQLFLRQNNRIALTDAGHAIYAGAAAGLQTISETVARHLQPAARARLVISAVGSVAEGWLLPQLAAYAAAHPDFRFDLRVEDDPVDFARHNIDLRLAYDPARYADLACTPLRHDSLLPLAAPAYLARHPALLAQGMAAVSGEDLIHTDWGPDFGSLPDWPGWFAAAGIAPPLTSARAGRGWQVGSSAMALELARQGLGVALGQGLLAAGDLAAGRLVALSTVTIRLGRAYALVHPPAKAAKRHIAGLTGWLLAHLPPEPS